MSSGRTDQEVLPVIHTWPRLVAVVGCSVGGTVAIIAVLAAVFGPQTTEVAAALRLIAEDIESSGEPAGVEVVSRTDSLTCTSNPFGSNIGIVFEFDLNGVEGALFLDHYAAELQSRGWKMVEESSDLLHLQREIAEDRDGHVFVSLSGLYGGVEIRANIWGRNC